jgi:2-polyprenyl-3-methyl-5-hydroxy-6-metoxy-1,4-benzoquinol methylase
VTNDAAGPPSTEAGPGTEEGQAVAAFAERVALAAIGGFELATIELGMRLGLYETLSGGPATAPELAAGAGIDARYAREWLEQQATAGIVSIHSEPPDGEPDHRVFALPSAHQVCLLDPDNLAGVAPLATFAVASSVMLPQLVEAYRQGTGISFSEYGKWVRQAQAGMNRPQFNHLLVAEWLPAMPDVLARLASGPARVADIGCGCGWASIAIARGLENVTVDGYDSDAASILDATANAAAAGVADKCLFEVRDASAGATGGYDLVCCFETLHDMAHPVAALTAMREMAAPNGAVLVVDERATEALTVNDPDPMQRLFYAASVLHCLPVGRNEHGSTATGTLLRPAILERQAANAGFASVEVLPIEHEAFRFYRLHP